jgi:hypothetical protein
MSDDAQRWKEKYLQSIEQQEKLERRWAPGSTCCAVVWCAARWRLKGPTARSINA